MISEESKALSRHGPYKRTASSHCLYKSMLSTHKQLFSLYLSYKVLVSPSSPPPKRNLIPIVSLSWPKLDNQSNLLFSYLSWNQSNKFYPPFSVLNLNHHCGPLNHHCGPLHLFWILESSLHKNVDRNSHTFLRILKCSVVNSPLYVHNLVEVDSEFLGKIC